MGQRSKRQAAPEAAACRDPRSAWVDRGRVRRGFRGDRTPWAAGGAGAAGDEDRAPCRRERGPSGDRMRLLGACTVRWGHDEAEQGGGPGQAQRGAVPGGSLDFMRCRGFKGGSVTGDGGRGAGGGRGSLRPFAEEPLGMNVKREEKESFFFFSFELTLFMETGLHYLLCLRVGDRTFRNVKTALKSV